MGFFNIFLKISSSLEGVFSFLVMFAAIAAIFFLNIILIKHIQVLRWIAVVLATTGSCFLMVPLTLAFNNFVTSRVGKIESNMATQSQVIKQQIEIDGLKETIRHLENTKFNIQAFERIFELGLLETPLEHTVFTRDFYDTDWKKQQVTQHNGIPLLGWGAGSEYYEYIEVMTNQITAKFGVDLKDIKLTYSEDQASIIVSGIQSKYLGNSKLIPNWEMSEIRRVTLDSSKNLKNTQILNSVEAERKRNTFMQQKIKNYQERLSQGLETDFMDEAVINLAQNFIKLFLAPLEKEVKFDNNDNAGLPLLEFIEKEIRDKNLLLEKKNEELPQGAYN